MKINAAKCLTCNATIYSRTRHDMRECLCDRNNCDTHIAIDGGFDYIKMSIAKNARYTPVKIDVDATKKTLYEDWKHSADKYGLIRVENNAWKFEIERVEEQIEWLKKVGRKKNET